MTDPNSPPSVSPRLIEAVQIELEAFLGRAPMTVGALTTLKTGDVVPLDAPLNQQVALHLNGVAIARGELVAVGDRFGVRLVELAEWPA